MTVERKVIRKRLKFYGWVQGVGFRYTALNAALNCGVTGWVRNEYDGTVSMEIQGYEEQIDRTLQLIENARYIKLERIESKTIAFDENEKSFKVRY